MKFATANPRVHTTLVGTASPQNLRDNLRWVDQPLAPELLAAARELLAPAHDTTWPSGLPENN